MSIADEIRRLNNAKANIKQAIANKGVEVSDSALLDEYPALISSISGEGGDPYYEDFYNLRTNNGTNMDSLFARTTGDLDLRKVDTSNITSMRYMFDYSSATVNIDGWDTSNVTNMSYMFNQFTGSIDISKLDTSNVTNASYMFYYANTDKIILTGLSFPKCTKLDYMFYYVTGTTLDLSSWDISNITSMSNMFSNTKYTRIDLTGWNTSHVTSMSSLFYAYNNPLVELIIPNWDMSSYSGNIFYNSSYMTNLKLIDLSESNDATITKIASYLPTRTTTTYGTVLVPYDTSQTVYDALMAKYWVPLGAALSLAPTSIKIVAELDEIYPGKSTKVYLDSCEPWNADPSKVEIVALDESIATIDEDNRVTSTGILGDIVLEARIKDTQEVVGTKTIAVSETDSYPNLVKFRLASTPSTSSTIITVNGSGKKLSSLTYDSITNIYSYDNGGPITSIKFSSNINDLIKLNTSNITTMHQMFYQCHSLTSVDLSNWDTSNVTNMNTVFYYCNSLTSLDLSGWDTSNVTDMTGIFQSCFSLQSVDLSNWDASNVTNLAYVFYSCHSLHTLRLDNCSNNTISMIITSSNLPTNAIEGVTRTIYCKESEAAGLTPPKNWVFEFVPEDEGGNEPEVPEEEIPLYNQGEFQDDRDIFDVRTMVTEEYDNLENMFRYCENLRSVNTQDWDVSNVTNMTEMFAMCMSLEELDLSTWTINERAMTNGIFVGCNNLRTLRLDDCSNSTISKIINSGGFPTNNGGTIYCKESEAFGLEAPGNWNFSFIDGEPEAPEEPPVEDIPLYVEGDFAWREDITEVRVMVDSSHIELRNMFNGCTNLVSINTQDWNTCNVTDMYCMFRVCSNITSLDLSNFITDKVIDMQYMFAYCRKLEILDISNFDMCSCSLESCYDMFSGCTSLHTLRLDNCSNDTISKIINSKGFPAGNDGTIYCRESEAKGLSAPGNWRFEYVD